MTDLQSARLIADWVPFLFALPAFCVCALYPWNASMAACAAMVVLAFILQGMQGLLFLTPYIIAGGLLGLGSRMGWKRGMLLLGSTLVLSIAALAQFTIFAALFGYNIETLQKEWAFLNGVLQPMTILIVLAVFMGSLQGLLLIMLGFLLERRLPRFFKPPAPFGFWNPGTGWAAAFLIWSLLLAGMIVVPVPVWIRDVLVIGEVVLYGIMVYAGWLYRIPASLSVRPWMRALMALCVWIPPVNALYAIYGLYHLLRKDRNDAVFQTRA